MGLQISCGVRAQGAAESDFRTNTSSSGTDLPRAGEAKGMSDSGGTSDARPRSYVHCDSPQAPGCISNRISEREECYRDSPLVWQAAEFLGRAFLGSRLCCFDSRI